MNAEPTTATGAMMRSHPAGAEALSPVNSCIDACFAAAQACTACADACQAELRGPELARCITLDLACADLCLTTLKSLSRQTAADVRLTRTTVAACALANQLCAEECRRHADAMEHCRLCAEACQRCSEACARVVDLLTT